MALKDFFRRKPEAGSASQVIKRVSDNGFGSYGLTLTGGTAAKLSHQTIMTNGAFSAGVRVIAESVSAVPFDLIRETTENGLRRRKKLTAKDHWAAALMDRPNSFMTRAQLYEFLIANAVLGKGALLLKTVVGKETRELMPVPATMWTLEVLSDPRDGYQFRVQFANGKQAIFPRNQCVFLSNIALDGFEAISVVDNASQTVAISNTLAKQQQVFAETGGLPRAALSFDQVLTSDQRREIREEWIEQTSEDASGLFTIGGGARLVPLTSDLSGQSAMEARKYAVAEAAQHLNIHPAYLGSDAGQKFANYNDLKAYHIETTVRPWIIRLEEVFTRDLLNNEPGLKFDGDEKSLMRGSFTEQVNALTVALGKGGTPAIISINEAREELGFDAIDEEWAKVPSRGGYAEAAGIAQEQEKDE